MIAKTSHELWREAFQQLDATHAPPIEPLMEAYSDPARFYHNWDHVETCLQVLQTTGELTAFHAIALFYHDCIYDTKRADNEEQSAELMARELHAVEVSKSHIGTIRRLILATRHSELPELRDEQLMVDADFSILGADPVDYRRYVEAIRREYGWVDDASFAKGRADFLRKLLAREHIYSMDLFRSIWETDAQRNIQGELDQLAS